MFSNELQNALDAMRKINNATDMSVLASEFNRHMTYIGKQKAVGIKKGDTVMIVEAMKTMNHVPSTSDGVVKEVCVEDGQPVEFGQTIIILE